MQLNDKWKKGKCGLTFVSKLHGKSAGRMSVVVLFRGITKVTSYFSRLPSFPPGACSSSSSIQVKGKYVHVLEDKQTWAHTSLLGGQGPWLSRAACGGLSGGCVKPTTAWKVRKPAELRRVSWWAPHLPARSSPSWLSACSVPIVWGMPCEIRPLTQAQYLFICLFRLRWVFTVVLRLSLLVADVGFSSCAMQD